MTMVYRGDPRRIHVSDGQRTAAGQAVAQHIDEMMRQHAQNRTAMERATQPLCPGCYMVVIYDAAIALADANGQSRRELAASLAGAFARLAEDPTLGYSEEIHVMLDPEEDEDGDISDLVGPPPLF